MKKIIFLFAIVLLGGCTDASWKQLDVLGKSGHIMCYSGGEKILDKISTGKIATESQSDGWYFKDALTGNLIRVSGTCVIEN